MLGRPRRVLAHAEARVVRVRTVGHAVGVHVAVPSKPQAELRARLLGRRVAVMMLVVVMAAMTDQPARHALVHALDNVTKLRLRRRTRGREHHVLAVGARAVDAVEPDDMLVRIEIQRATGQVGGGHEPGRATPDGALLAEPLQQPIDLRTEDTVDGAEHVGVARHRDPQRERCAQDPLPNGHVGEDSIHQVGRGLRRASRCARAADPSRFAGKCDKHRRSALRTKRPCEPPGQDPATLVASQLVLHVARQSAVVRLRRGLEERLEPSVDDLPKHGRLGLSALVFRAQLGVRGHHVGCTRRLGGGTHERVCIASSVPACSCLILRHARVHGGGGPPLRERSLRSQKCAFRPAASTLAPRGGPPPNVAAATSRKRPVRATFRQDPTGTPAAAVSSPTPPKPAPARRKPRSHGRR